MRMKSIAASLAACAALAAGAAGPAPAQPGGYYNGGGGWDRDAFWRDAPANPYDRIAFLQRRIDDGIANGSLSRSETRNSQAELDAIRRDADRVRYRHNGRLSQADFDSIQSRLDRLSRQLRWRRHNGAGGYGGYAGGNGYAGGYGARDRYATDYDAAHYYHDGNYQERRLADSDEVYRGSDGRYYCKRSDGTTGLIIGGVGGGILGNIIDGGHNRAAGTLIGGAIGALAGRSVAQSNDIRCR